MHQVIVYERASVCGTSKPLVVFNGLMHFIPRVGGIRDGSGR
jgi:hypothetical protein